MHARGTVAVAFGLLVALGAGCADDSGAPGSGLANEADERAHRAGTVMTRNRNGTNLERVHMVVGGSPPSGPGIEALVADGDRFDGRIVLRITERREASGLDPGETVVRCYEYRFDFDAGVEDIDGHHIDCPDRAALVVPTPTTSTIPVGLVDTLQDALERLAADGADEAAVREAVTSLANGAAVVEVASVDGAIGVAVGNGDDDCVTGRILPDRSVEVWAVPRVVAQPGELGCSASAAAAGQGKESPH